jgi:hypothetical protein
MNSLEKYGITQTSDKDQAYDECGGVSPKVLGTANGQKVLIKTGTHDEGHDCFAEYFAYKLGAAIGIAVNEVKLVDCGDLLGFRQKLCSVHTWENDFCTAGSYGGSLDQVEENKLSFFDEIINNDDRHGSNYGVLNDKLFCIDHGFAYPWKTKLYEDGDWLLRKVNKSGVGEVVDKFLSLTEKDFEEMVSLPEDLDHKLGSEYFTGTVERMLKCQELIRKNKEEAVA